MPSPPGNRGTLPELAFNVLLALGDGPRHGYAIIQEIEERTGSQSTVRSGTLYAVLQSLHGEGLLEDAPAPPGVDGRRRYYRITDAGREAVAREAARLSALVRRAVELRLAPDVPGGEPS
ncbi:MAG: PadR family transcriptional regulator [Gemmatimonadota bacterium]|jgi:DNA-binding PadR family transcriptional regulator